MGAERVRDAYRLPYRPLWEPRHASKGSLRPLLGNLLDGRAPVQWYAGLQRPLQHGHILTSSAIWSLALAFTFASFSDCSFTFMSAGYSNNAECSRSVYMNATSVLILKRSHGKRKGRRAYQLILLRLLKRRILRLPMWWWHWPRILEIFFL